MMGSGIKNVLRALGASFMGIFHVVMLWILALLFFCIIGVQLFAGRLNLCSDFCTLPCGLSLEQT